MLKVGLTGGYATGKSFVARQLESLGCLVIYADKLGHQVLESSGSAYEPVLALFGKRILGRGGTIDRKRLGAIVFASPDLLRQLTDIVHPAVFELEQRLLSGFESQKPHGIAVLEAAILIEAGRHARFDKLIVTSCDLETQIVRAMQRDKLTRAEVEQRLARQLAPAERLRFADYIIDTDCSPAETIEQVNHIHTELRQLAEASSS